MAKNTAAKENVMLDRVLADIRACRACPLPHIHRPTLRAGAESRICIVGQAPGLRVHNTGISFNDPSGSRLRAWLGVTPEVFYDPANFAIVPMGFCFPGYDATGADLPPRRECAPLWRERLFDALPDFRLILLVGHHAQKWHLGAAAKSSMTETVRAWRDYRPLYIPTPHPSWRNNAWLKRNPWFEAELLPCLRARVRRVLSR